MDSQKGPVNSVEGELRSQIQEAGDAEITSSASSEIGFSSELRRPSSSAPQISAGRLEVSSSNSTKPSASSSHLPPLTASKCGNNSASHGQVPRSHLRSRVSLEKNKVNIPVTASQDLSSGTPPFPPPFADKRTTSLPGRALNAHPSAIHSEYPKGHSHELASTGHSEQLTGHEKVNIIRSFSTPLVGGKVESFRRDGKGYVLLRTASPRTTHTVQPSEAVDVVNPHLSTEFDVEKGKGSTKDEVEEAISEEEAVCRICMDSLSEDYGETLKMECRCLGEMALAHKNCAFKWFGMKGDRVCEVCGSIVSNIPVTVVRVLANENNNHVRSIEGQTGYRCAGCQDIPALGIINMVAYFCFIEKLLVNKLGTTKALAISIPFSVVLGLLAAVTSVALVSRRYNWMYAAVQFALVCFFGYIFYCKTKLEAVLAVILAAFSGFGVAMTSNALLLEYFHWKQYTAQRADVAASRALAVRLRSGESYRISDLGNEVGVFSFQLSQDLTSLHATSRDLELGSEPATARGSPSARSQAASART